MCLSINTNQLVPSNKTRKRTATLSFTSYQVKAGKLSNKVPVKNRAPLEVDEAINWNGFQFLALRGERLMLPIVELSVFRGLESFQKLFSLLYFLLLPRLIPFVFGCQYFDYAWQCSRRCICVEKSESRSPSNKINRRFTVLIASTVGNLGL